MSAKIDVENLAEQLPTLIAERKATLKDIQNEMKILKDAGLIYAREHWRAGKYLYLIYPCHDGRRERKYVGADRAKIEAAQASIRRASEYDRLENEAQNIERILQQGGERIRDAIFYLSGRRVW